MPIRYVHSVTPAPRRSSLLLTDRAALRVLSRSGTPARYVVLESHRFTWNAVRGLGWGSRLAPVLARLDELDGVAESRVEWVGRRILLKLEADGVRARTATQALKILGDGARVLGVDEARDVFEGYHLGEPWLRAGDTVRLSHVEANVLAKRFCDEAVAEMEVGHETARRLLDVFEQEFVRAFERSHAGRGFDDVPGEIELAAGRILAAGAVFLDGDDWDRLEDFLSLFRGAGTRWFRGLTINK